MANGGAQTGNIMTANGGDSAAKNNLSGRMAARARNKTVLILVEADHNH